MIQKAMKRNIKVTLLAASLLSAMAVISCDPMEPSTYSENFFRVATVKFEYGKVGFYTDYEHATYYTVNLKDTASAIAEGLHEGMRIKAWFTLDAVGTMNNNTITLNGYAPLESTRCVSQKPSDTLNYYYYFAEYDITHDILELQYTSDLYTYPSVWAEGHIVNVAPTYFVPSAKDTAAFFVYPYDVRNDTLVLRLYSYIPDCDVSLNPVFRQKLLSIDISSVRDSASTPAEQAVRDTILNRLDRLHPQNIYVTVETTETARAKNSKNGAGQYTMPISGLPTKPVQIPFDF